ncbi:hypothetical protein L3X38_011075 [Prunus dulcis]|uniref:Reverse transcriptase Ty1/copia-type domain-containing protein n=1 Tax=Prunus dulcis TaxID=3755 RepID=A0AAD4WH38_PRUDU|nr:hypothetical protein L3X38_011075 [Prunus dulcis]
MHFPRLLAKSKGIYRCLDPSTGRVFLSRHVVFDETTFPCSTLHTRTTGVSSLPSDSAPIVFSPATPPLTAVSSSPPTPLAAHAAPPSPEPVSTITSTVSLESASPMQSPMVPVSSSPLQVVPTTHPMVTQGKDHWLKAMEVEDTARQQTKTWTLVPHTPSMNVLPNKWVYHIKQSDGTIERYKARLVANGFHQQPGFDYGETFSPVVNQSTIRLILGLAVHRNDPSQITQLIHHLGHSFSMKDLGSLHYFRAIEASWTTTGLHLIQSKYVLDLLKRTNMLDVKPVSTPGLSSKRLSLHDGDPLPDVTKYCSVVGALQYLTITRSDDCRSIGGYCIYLGSNLVSWSSKKQKGVSRSSTEVKYQQLAQTAATLSWFRYLFRDLRLPLPCPQLWYDHVSAISLASNPVFHYRTRHIEVDFHYV